ncbi:autotransporter outer membrane beta-barrel domain-containing protein [Candidatus Magnetaquicoccus inordinatus]|uniref:autotransporter outer membrane beta-barrel domain-containing protein n=1 Tax=Candidatus Magnetaquicoccus inordinatus TaxID=2496818 RepID=UPI00102AC348|nr:autotransporter outer membrane beta-barrel domain-containing protein [Candidatus Magnetaquicoccus inordinatus]
MSSLHKGALSLVAGTLLIAALPNNAEATYDDYCQYAEYQSSSSCKDLSETTQTRTGATQTISLIGQGAVRSLRGSSAGTINTTLLGDTVMTGLAAGSAAPQNGIWGNYDYTRVGDSLFNTTTKLHNFVIGGDRKIQKDLALGASFTFQDTNSSQIHSDAEAWTIAPYMAYLINNNMSLDLVAGYTWITTENGVAAGEHDSKRYFIAPNLSAYTTNLGKWEIDGHLGFMYVKDKVDGYTGSTAHSIDFSQVKTGIGVSYSATDSLQPYFNLDYEQDLVYKAANANYSDTGIAPGLGLRINLPASLVGDVRVGSNLGRRNIDQESITANIRMNF